MGPFNQQDGRAAANAMARFLVVLKPREPLPAAALIEGLSSLMHQLEAEVDHRTTAHLSALLRGGEDALRLQLFADVQARPGGSLLELLLMSREAMGRGAPQTRLCFEQLVELAAEAMPGLDLVFRSDRDGPMPSIA
jgi:hypothetical protein